MNCYFCNSYVIPFLDINKSGNYENHYCCYQCPSVPYPTFNLDVWKQPYHIIKNDNKINVIYIYFHNIMLWLQIYYFDRPFLDIKDTKNNCLLRLNQQINPFDYNCNVLENKIKTWITFL